MIGQVLLALAFAWLIYSATCLSINIRRARTMGVPLVVVPISPMNVLWIVVEPLIFRLLDHLPIHLGTFGRYGRRGWHFHDKAQSHLELGDIFALVTPRETFVHLAQPDAILEVFSRRMDFIRPIQLYRRLPPSPTLPAYVDGPIQRCWMFSDLTSRQWVHSSSGYLDQPLMPTAGRLDGLAASAQSRLSPVQ